MLKLYKTYLNKIDPITLVLFILISFSFNVYYKFTIPFILFFGFVQLYRVVKNKIPTALVLELSFYLLIYSLIFFRSVHTAILIFNLIFHVYRFLKKKNFTVKIQFKVEVLVLIFFALIFINQILFKPSLATFETYLYVFLYPLLFYFIKKNKMIFSIEKSLVTFIFSVVIACVILIVSNLYNGTLNFKTNTYFAEYIDLSHVYFGVFLGTACSFIFVLLDKKDKILSNKVAVLLLLLFVFLMIYSGARMALIATLIILGVFLFKKIKLLWYVKSFISIIIVITLMFVSYNFIPRAKQDVHYISEVYKSVKTNNKKDIIHNSWRNMYQRFLVTKYTLEEIKNNSTLGIGLVNVKRQLGKRIHSDGYKYFEAINPHNQYLHFWLGMGGFVFFYFLFMTATFLKTQISEPYFWMFFMLIMFTESILVRVKGISIFFLFSILLSIKNKVIND